MGRGRPGGPSAHLLSGEYERTIHRLLGLDIDTLALGHHYRTPTVPRDSVHFGPNVKTYLRASREIADMIGDSLRTGAVPVPGADFQEVAQAATDLVADGFPITKGDDGLPLYGNVEAFYGYWQLLR